MVRSMCIGVWVLACGGAAAGASVQANKCVGPDGRIRYQQMPCERHEQAEVLTVEGEIDAQRKAEADARLAANAPTPRPSPAPAVAPATPAPPAVRAKVVCPATREKPGGAPALGTDPMAMAINRDWYARLPSRTSLKNAGRWPEECD